MSAEWAPALAIVVVLGAPWVAPSNTPFFRLAAGLLGWLLAQKVMDLATRAPRDPKTDSSLGAFMLWLLSPTSLRWPTTAAAQRANRRRGARRALRAVVKALAALSLLLLSQLQPALHGVWVLDSLWALWLGYFIFSGGFDVATSIPMMAAGVLLGENFASPYLARSPQEFWARRWNRWVHGLLLRYVFKPLRGRPGLGIACCFAVSGAAHEYLVYATLGRFHGGMLVFFALSGGAVWAQRALRNRWTATSNVWAARAVHIAWLVAISPFFMDPILTAIPLRSW